MKEDTVYITLSGYAAKLPLHLRAKRPIEVNPDINSILSILLYLPKDFKSAILKPDRVNHGPWQQLETNWRNAELSRMAMNAMVERDTIDWIKNFCEIASILYSEPPRFINSIQRTGNTAYIVGNGISAVNPDNLALIRSNQQDTFACFHVLPKLLKAGIEPGFCCHIDKAKPVLDFQNCKVPMTTALVTTPSAWPGLILENPCNQIFWSLPINCWFHGFIAKSLNGPEHPLVSGTVINLMIDCIGYAGYKKAKLIGVDLSWPDKEQAYGNRELIQDFSKDNQPVWTTDVLKRYQINISETIMAYPDISFQNLSHGLIIPGA